MASIKEIASLGSSSEPIACSLQNPAPHLPAETERRPIAAIRQSLLPKREREVETWHYFGKSDPVDLDCGEHVLESEFDEPPMPSQAYDTAD